MTDGPHPESPRPPSGPPSQNASNGYPPYQPTPPPGAPSSPPARPAYGPDQPSQYPGQSPWQQGPPQFAGGQPYGQQRPYSQQPPPGQPPYPQPFQAQRPPKKSRKGIIVGASIVGALIILGVAGFLTVGQLNKTQHGPDKAADRYLAALASGDVDAVKAIAPPVVPDGASDALLNNAAVKASAAKITNARVLRTTTNGDNATISVGYSVGSRPQVLQLVAEKDGKESLFFDKWKLTGPALNTVSVQASGSDNVTVNGTKVALKNGKATLAAYPGSYKIAIPDTKYFDGSDDTVTVGFAQRADDVTPTPVMLTRKANGALTTEVEKQVKSIVDKCVASKDPRVKGCPFYSAETDIKPGTVKWKLSKEPTISVTASPDGKIIILPDSSGQITYRADSKHPGSTGKYWTGGGSFSVFGSGTVDGDKVTVTLTSGA